MDRDALVRELSRLAADAQGGQALALRARVELAVVREALATAPPPAELPAGHAEAAPEPAAERQSA
jgi:hypothetical protein